MILSRSLGCSYPRYSPPWGVGHLCDVVRDLYQGEVCLQALQLALPGHRRGSPHQEREVDAVTDCARVQIDESFAVDGNPASEQPARTVVAAQLPVAGRLQFCRRL